MNNREEYYSSKLAQMIQMETVSIYKVKQKEKFEEFHLLLKKLFPKVFSKCEVVDIDGSLLIKYKSEINKCEPILFMSHQDVVEASGK